MLKKYFFNILYTIAICLAGCSPEADKAEWLWHVGDQATFDGQISSDGQHLLIAQAGAGVQIWHVGTKKALFHWQHQSNQNSDIFITRFSSDNLYVVTASPTEFALWRVSDGKALGFWQITDARIRDIAVSAQAQVILIGQSDGKVVSFEPRNGRRTTFLAHQDKINSVAISPSGEFAISGSNEYVAYFWRVDTGDVIHRFVHPNRVTKVALDQNGAFLFTADSQGQAHIWQQASGQRQATLNLAQQQRMFNTARFNHDSTQLVTGSPDRTLELWQTKNGLLVKSFTVNPKPNSKTRSAVVYSAAFHPSNHSLVSFSSSGYLEQWSYHDASVRK
ncbi:WD40 repeat domain-containing protein [Algibacillus agarilyticus]|uniref:WD40 repeat domain-containing protein n=1 Tax=Algibacillus agarilyticus TaxID=2234133 RepID=UPI001300A005|nr:hypothetical protein [Algibacillus agarilyticus]